MNVFIVEDGVLRTPPLEGTILPGITRASILELAGDLGLRAEEQRLDIEDVAEGIRSGRITEMFAAGTAAVVTSIGELGFRRERLALGDGLPGEVAKTVYDGITAIQYGRAEDRQGWMRRVRRHAAADNGQVLGAAS